MTDIPAIKDKAKKMWSTFAPFENVTGLAAPELVKFSGLKKGDKVLDVACGTGVVAITAVRLGATVCGSDITPELIKRAKENAEISKYNIDFTVADVEELPYDDNSFDFVMSYGVFHHTKSMEKCLKEMVRVSMRLSDDLVELELEKLNSIIKKCDTEEERTL